uniref:Uncharacterized protein n=1 Tax=Lactuca sativa TaxID=4236 RepID=A0A9R1WPK1_LACSA|nr:hypothetical protein LSAT_V11C100038990 [Lactuca sativa]
MSRWSPGMLGPKTISTVSKNKEARTYNARNRQSTDLMSRWSPGMLGPKTISTVSKNKEARTYNARTRQRYFQQMLSIGGLNKPMSEWGLQNFPTSLVQLYLEGENSGVVSFAVADDLRNTSTTPSSSSSFLLPPSLVFLEINGFKDVESFSEVLPHLPCLKTLNIWSCPKITDLKTTSGPSNLTITVR